MHAATRRLGAYVRAVLGPDVASVRQGAVALLLSSGGDLLAGLTLGAITGTLERLPGLLVLVPAAIGMRGNIFGALGSRLGTAILTGTFRLSSRRDTVVGQNIAASLVLTLAVSVGLAVLAKTIAVTFGVADTISIADYVVISVLGGVAASAIVLLITVAVAAGSARYGWDLDTVSAPVVTAAGDVVTLPSLFLATFLVSIPIVTPAVAVVTSAVAVVVLVAAMRSPLDLLRRIVRESLPVLIVAGAVDIVAGLTIEKRLESFVAYPALLVLIPPFLEDAGALGGILSSRLSSKLHLGVIGPTSVPQRAARRDFLLIVVFAVPVFVFVALSADVAAIAFGLPSPGPLRMIAVALLGGTMATIMAIVVAYYGAIGAYRFGLDPDNHGIPLVTSSMDLVGAMSLILAIVLLGLA
jgi:mgtE-like transporter